MERSLVTSIGLQIKERPWIEYIRHNNIDKVIILRLTEKYDPYFTLEKNNIEKHIEEHGISEKEGEDILKASETLHTALEILERMYIPYEYYEISKEISKESIISFLMQLLISQEGKNLIDFSRGERLFIPLFLTIASFIPEKIIELFSLDFRTGSSHQFPYYFIDSNPDNRGSNTIKEILSLFIEGDFENFSDVTKAKILRSKEIERKLPKMNPTHLKTRLNTISDETPGKPALIESRVSENDKRVYEYFLTSNGLFLIYANFLREKYLVKKSVKEKWYTNCSRVFEQVNFQGISKRKEFILEKKG